MAESEEGETYQATPEYSEYKEKKKGLFAKIKEHYTPEKKMARLQKQTEIMKSKVALEEQKSKIAGFRIGIKEKRMAISERRAKSFRERQKSIGRMPTLSDMWMGTPQTPQKSIPTTPTKPHKKKGKKRKSHIRAGARIRLAQQKQRAINPFQFW